MAEEKRILTVGDALIDVQYWVERIPASGEDVRIISSEENCGGSAANTAVGLAWLGVSCGFCGRVGSDERGDRVLRSLEGAGVDTGLVRRQGETGYVLSMIDADGERTMYSYRGTAAQLDRGWGAALAAASIVLFSGYLLSEESQAETAIALMQGARAGGAEVALDASPKFGSLPKSVKAAALKACDVFLPNLDELAAAGPAAEDVPCLAVKMGARGAFWQSRDPQIRLYSPALPVAALDATGAGDAFNAGFLAARLQGKSPREQLESGNRTAALVVARRGAVSAFT